MEKEALMLRTTLGFLDIASTRHLFLKEMARIYGEHSPDYQLIERMHDSTERLLSVRPGLIERVRRSAILAIRRGVVDPKFMNRGVGMRKAESVAFTIGQRNRDVAHRRGYDTWDQDMVIQEYGENIENALDMLSLWPLSDLQEDEFHERFKHSQFWDVVHARLSYMYAKLLELDDMREERASAVLRTYFRHYRDIAENNRILFLEFEDLIEEFRLMNPRAVEKAT